MWAFESIATGRGRNSTCVAVAVDAFRLEAVIDTSERGSRVFACGNRSTLPLKDCFQDLLPDVIGSAFGGESIAEAGIGCIFRPNVQPPTTLAVLGFEMARSSIVRLAAVVGEEAVK